MKNNTYQKQKHICKRQHIEYRINVSFFVMELQSYQLTAIHDTNVNQPVEYNSVKTPMLLFGTQ